MTSTRCNDVIQLELGDRINTICSFLSPLEWKFWILHCWETQCKTMLQNVKYQIYLLMLCCFFEEASLHEKCSMFHWLWRRWPLILCSLLDPGTHCNGQENHDAWAMKMRVMPDQERGQLHGSWRLLILMSSVRLLCVSKPSSKVKMRREKACHFFGPTHPPRKGILSVQSVLPQF